MRDFKLFIELIKSDGEYDREIENKFKIEFLEMEDDKSWRILHYACSYGRVELVNLLLSNKCQMNSQTKDGRQPIHLACEKGYIDIVEILITNKCDIDAADKKGYQPIHLACENGHIDIVEILIANKCDIDAADKKGYQPIHLACWKGQIKIVKILTENKCDMNSFDNNGYQPIHWACAKGHIDVVEILIEKKCDINAYNYNYYQPIHLAFINSHIEIVKILIINKCDINASDKEGYQPIHWACWNGHADIVKILIENKCDIKSYDKKGYQGIHWACHNGHTDIVEILIENKFDINASNKSGLRPIYFACVNGHIDIVEKLILNNCEIHKLSEKEESLINIAKKRGLQEIVNILKNEDLIRSIAKKIEHHFKTECDPSIYREFLKKENFKTNKEIGHGAYGKVYKYIIPNTNREIVIKQTKEKEKEDRKNIEENINKYSYNILHKNIVRYFGAVEKLGKLCIFMEYMPGGSLKDLIDRSKWLESSKVIKFSKQVLKGLHFLHSNGIIHRDIKPDNMLLDHDETLKLTDFGLSKLLRNESFSLTTKNAGTFCGTPNYLAPEVYLNEPYSFPADIWSTGASIIHMITGKKPYHGESNEAALFIIGNEKKIEFTPCQPISEVMQSFIGYLLTPQQEDRPKAKSLLRHPIFENVE